MDIKRRYMNNTGKPKGLFGKIMIKSMNKHHADVSDWGLSHIPKKDYELMMDIGCGGGKNLSKLLKIFPETNFTGTDYSSVSLKSTERLNKEEIESGRLNLVKADVSSLPFKDGTYDYITACETVYFWPGPLKSFKEIYRVLKDNGTFMIINASNGIDEDTARWSKEIDGITFYEEDELKGYLKEAGFKNLKIERKGTWILIQGEK